MFGLCKRRISPVGLSDEEIRYTSLFGKTTERTVVRIRKWSLSSFQERVLAGTKLKHMLAAVSVLTIASPVIAQENYSCTVSMNGKDVPVNFVFTGATRPELGPESSEYIMSLWGAYFTMVSGVRDGVRVFLPGMEYVGFTGRLSPGGVLSLQTNKDRYVGRCKLVK